MNRMNCFDRCGYCEESWSATGHTEECTEVYDDNEWLAGNYPRYHENYIQKSAYEFGLMYQFHAMCVGNLMYFFDFGGDTNNLKDTDTFVCPQGLNYDWVHVLNRIFETSPRHFHLLNDIVSISLACGDLGCESGPCWYCSSLKMVRVSGKTPTREARLTRYLMIQWRMFLTWQLSAR